MYIILCIVLWVIKLFFLENASPGVVYLICLVYEFYLKTLITHPIFTDSGEVLPTFPL